MIMNKEKLKGYESPTTDVLELRSEGIICASLSKIALEDAIDDAIVDDWGTI